MLRQLSGLADACSMSVGTALMANGSDSLLRLLTNCACAGHDMPNAAGDTPTHVDQSVLTVIAADTTVGLEVRLSTVGLGVTACQLEICSQGAEQLAIAAASVRMHISAGLSSPVPCCRLGNDSVVVFQMLRWCTSWLQPRSLRKQLEAPTLIPVLSRLCCCMSVQVGHEPSTEEVPVFPGQVAVLGGHTLAFATGGALQATRHGTVVRSNPPRGVGCQASCDPGYPKACFI